MWRHHHLCLLFNLIFVDRDLQNTARGGTHTGPRTSWWSEAPTKGKLRKSCLDARLRASQADISYGLDGQRHSMAPSIGSHQNVVYMSSWQTFYGSFGTWNSMATFIFASDSSWRQDQADVRSNKVEFPKTEFSSHHMPILHSFGSGFKKSYVFDLVQLEMSIILPKK